MLGKKRILVACGTAIATSTVVAKAIEEAKFAKGSAPRSVHYPADKLFKAGKDDSAGEVESDEDGDSD